jgi:hypothetical protein
MFFQDVTSKNVAGSDLDPYAIIAYGRVCLTALPLAVTTAPTGPVPE